MVYPVSWHCSGSLVTTVLTEDCTVTATTSDSVAGASSSPLMVQDSGNVSFGLAVIITMLAMMLVAFLFNSFGGSKKR